MRSMVKFGMAALAFGMATSSHAALVLGGSGPTTTLTASGGSGGTQVLNFNGFNSAAIPGLTAQLTLNFIGASGNTYTFGYSLLNNSSAPVTSSRIFSFGFDVDPSFSSASVTGNIYNAVRAPSGNIPNQIGPVEICFRPTPNGNPNAGDCTGGPGGATIGQSGSGLINLNFSQPVTSFPSTALSNFYVRYQSLDYGNVRGDSAVGRVVTPPPAVPEPATWAMMMLGFGGIGFALRGRRREGVTTRVRFA